MSVPRFYCGKLSPGVVTLDELQSRHAWSSLRLGPDDEVLVFDGAGAWARGTLVANEGDKQRKSRRKVSIAVERVECESPPRHELIQIVSACKGPRLTWMIEKLTEIGVTGIVIAEFERSVVHVGAARVEKLRRTVIEAAKQSRRLWLPSIEAGVLLDDALAAVVSDGAATNLLVAHPAEKAAAWADCLSRTSGAASRVVAVVGPEGGLTNNEIQKLSEANGRFVRLSRHILRVETAALSVAAAWAAFCD